MIDWEAKRKKIAAKIAEKGGAAVLVRTTTAYDKRADKTTTSTVNVPCFCFIGNEEGTDDQGRAVLYSVATLTEEPKSNDKLLVGTQAYLIAKTVTVAPAGVPILWTAILSA